MDDNRIIAIRKEDVVLANQAFDNLMSKTERRLNELSEKDPLFYKELSPVKLEEESCEVIKTVCKDTPFNPENVKLVSGHSFPDIVAENYYGVEVKSTKSDHWTSTGSSIVESTRNKEVDCIYMLFGKLGGNIPVFKCRPYSDVLYDIAVTHSPRYLIDMELNAENTIFQKMSTTYDEFRKKEDKISLVRDYYKKKAHNAGKQEMPWWITNENVDNPVSINLRLWNSIDAEEKKNLISYCLILFPEIWDPQSNAQKRYNQASLWLCSYAQVVCPNLRDSFTAGGRVTLETVECNHIYKTIVDNWDRIKKLLEEPSNNTLKLIEEFNSSLFETKGKGTYCEKWKESLKQATSNLKIPWDRLIK